MLKEVFENWKVYELTTENVPYKSMHNECGHVHHTYAVVKITLRFKQSSHIDAKFHIVIACHIYASRKLCKRLFQN